MMEPVLQVINSLKAESESESSVAMAVVVVASVKDCDVCDGLAEGAVDVESL